MRFETIPCLRSDPFFSLLLFQTRCCPTHVESFYQLYRPVFHASWQWVEILVINAKRISIRQPFIKLAAFVILSCSWLLNFFMLLAGLCRYTWKLNHASWTESICERLNAHIWRTATTTCQTSPWVLNRLFVRSQDLSRCRSNSTLFIAQYGYHSQVRCITTDAFLEACSFVASTVGHSWRNYCDLWLQINWAFFLKHSGAYLNLMTYHHI